MRPKSMKKSALDPCEEDVEMKPPLDAIGVIGNIGHIGRRVPEATELQLHINEAIIQAGGSITGTVCLGSFLVPSRVPTMENEEYPAPEVRMTLEGYETTVVATADEARDDILDDEKAATAERRSTHTLIRSDMELRNWVDSNTLHFTVHIPDDLPTSMTFVNGGYPNCSSKCSIEYTLTVSVPDRFVTVSRAIPLLGRTNHMDAIDTSLTSRVGKVIPALRSYACGLWAQRLDTFELEPSKPSLCVHPEQSFRAILEDPSHALPKPKRSVAAVIDVAKPGFHVRLDEFISWTDSGHVDSYQNSWELAELTKIATSDATSKQVMIPGSLHISYDGVLMHVRHEIVFFVRNSRSEVIASTPGIPVKVVLAGNAGGISGGRKFSELDHLPQLTDTSTIGEEERLVEDSFSYDVPL